MENKESRIDEPYRSKLIHELENNKSVKEQKKKKFIRECMIYLFILVFCIYLLPTFLLQKTYVDGPSMENTLYNKDILLVDKLTFQFKSLQRFDVIVFYPHGNHDAEYYVKRVIGLPGEKVQIIGDTIYINDYPIDESYGKNAITYAGIAGEPIHLGKDEFFVLGDNREISLDSRYEEVGVVNKESVGGKVVLRIWPFKRIGKIE